MPHKQLQMSHGVVMGCPKIRVRADVGISDNTTFHERVNGDYVVQHFTVENRVVHCKERQSDPKSCLYYMHTKGNNKQFWAVGPHPGLDHAWAIANVFPSHPELIPDNGWMVYEKTGKYWEPGKMEITCVLKELPSSYHDGL